MTLIQKIIELKKNHNLSKHEQLVNGVIEAIEEEDLLVGDQLPSINTMVGEIGYARKTIVKAYEELKNRGLVESKKLKGYYIASLETKTVLKVALLLFAFQSFQEEFYNTFRNKLGKQFQIDVYFHHNNIAIFETILSNIKGKYGKYVIAPIQRPEVLPLLQNFVPHKLLVIDRYVPMEIEYSFIAQEFEKSTYNRLVELLPAIKKYRRFIFFFTEETEYTPKGILRSFNRFTSEFNIEAKVKKSYRPGSLKKNELYFIASDIILWQIIKDCLLKEYKIGNDVGILSHNDDMAKELVFGGITTISSDFNNMAKMAAKQVITGTTTQRILSLDLIKRNSI